MHHAFAQVIGQALWLMEPTAFRAMLARAEAATSEEIQVAVQAYQDREQGPRLVGDVAVIDICGPITYKPSWFSMFFGGATILDLQMQHRSALADPAVRSIVFRVDSPGGEVTMVPEFADEVFAARGIKPTVAVADMMIASAALWIAAQADTIYTSVSGQIGSVGVYAQHEDLSQMLEKIGIKETLIFYGSRKVDGHPYAPLSDEARTQMQAQVDMVGKEFDAAMARGRSVSLADVKSSFGQGLMFRGRQAIGAGLADKVATVNQLLAKLARGRASAGAMAAADAEPIKVVLSLDEQKLAAAVVALVPSVVSVAKQAEMVEPDENGECPEGYEKGDDDMCHLKPMDEPMDDKGKASADAQRAADNDAVNLSITLGA